VMYSNRDALRHELSWTHYRKNYSSRYSPGLNLGCCELNCYLDRYPKIGYTFNVDTKVTTKEVSVMSIAADLLKANHVGIRDIKEHLSTRLLKDILVITDRGTPVSVNLPYSDVLELIDIIDEAADLETMATVSEGRLAIREGAKGILVADLFKRIRTQRK